MSVWFIYDNTVYKRFDQKICVYSNLYLYFIYGVNVCELQKRGKNEKSVSLEKSLAPNLMCCIAKISSRAPHYTRAVTRKPRTSSTRGVMIFHFPPPTTTITTTTKTACGCEYACAREKYMARKADFAAGNLARVGRARSHKFLSSRFRETARPCTRARIICMIENAGTDLIRPLLDRAQWLDENLRLRTRFVRRELPVCGEGSDFDCPTSIPDRMRLIRIISGATLIVVVVACQDVTSSSVA